MWSNQQAERLTSLRTRGGNAQLIVDFEPRPNSHLGCLLSIINPAPMVEGHVTPMKHSGQPRKRAVASEITEVTFGFEHTCGGPAQNHSSTLPAFDAPRDLAHPAKQVLDQVG
jgi:hypothetical protein